MGLLGGLMLPVILGVGACGIVAAQRAARLRSQLDGLAKTLRVEYEASRAMQFQDTDARKLPWTEKLNRIMADGEMTSDRFVRLNDLAAHHLRDLSSSLGAIECGVLKKFSLEAADQGNRTILAAIHHTEIVRNSITICSFFEWPCPNVNRRDNS